MFETQGKEEEACLKRSSDNILAAGFTAIDYLSYCDGDSLAKLETHTQNGMLLAAVYLGNVRLIDQLKV